MSKNTVEQSNALSIFWLKKKGYLNKEYSYKSGGIIWSYEYSENKSSINFSIVKENWGTSDEGAYINLKYTQTDHYTGKKIDMDYKIQLTTTPCRYGGKRYWFVCPLTKDGKYCGKRVGIIYSINRWFGCRHCGNFAYAKQMEGGKYRWNGVSIPDLERAEKEVTRYYYRGKPTRKFKRLMRLNDRFEQGLGIMMSGCKNRLDRLKNK